MIKKLSEEFITQDFLIDRVLKIEIVCWVKLWESLASMSS